ncbi:MAG: cytochrome c1 [Proteobacteria bacterium]|nr:cytochrome c1 [Pseudomonadota bacterium]
MKKHLLTFLALTTFSLLNADSKALPPLQKQMWSFDGFLGKFDRAQLQRGFQVFKEVCATCHSLKYIRFRDLSKIGFSEMEIKALAASYEIHDGPNDEGEMFDRKGLPSDAFPWIYKNANQARSVNHGAFPPDLSLIVSSKKDGADYLFALLTSFDCPPEGTVLHEGQYWNKVFPGHLISMAPPLLNDNQVAYSDGTKATIDQMARDVTAFLAFTAEPDMEKRKQTGIDALIFLSLLTILSYIVKRRIWNDIR